MSSKAPCNSILDNAININEYSNTIIYNSAIDNTTVHNDMLIDIMTKAFPSIVKPEMTPKEIVDEVNNKTGYLIKKITKVKSGFNEYMFNAYRTARCLDETYKNVFHGTCDNNVEQICKENFSLLKIKKTLYGVGIYTASSFFTGLCYATPNVNNEQTVIIAKLLVGPIAIGKPGQTDYGKDANNNPILTLTDNTGTYNCASNSNQLLIIATITVECQTIKHQDNIPLLKSQLNYVIYYNHMIWNVMKDNKNIIGTKAHNFAIKQTAINNAAHTQAQANALAQSQAIINAHNKARMEEAKARSLAQATAQALLEATNPINVPVHGDAYKPRPTQILIRYIHTSGEKAGDKINEGDIVVVNNTYSNYKDAINFEGKVVRITKCSRTLVHVLIHDEKIKEFVIKQNSKKKTYGGFPYAENQDNSWLAVPPDYVTVISSPVKNNNGGSAIAYIDKDIDEDVEEGKDKDKNTAPSSSVCEDIETVSSSSVCEDVDTVPSSSGSKRKR